ncbi:MAG: hypothetical protein M3347_12945 [Armatimonadota bacterium]|nr:hypothetical protein [Armatimonadota bacterium]
MPYAKSAQLFKCPSDSVRNVGNSYLFNNNISRRALADIPEPSALVIGMDGQVGTGGNRDPGNVEATPSGNVPTYGLAEDYTIWVSAGRVACNAPNRPRHLGASNLLYGDGHVKISPPLPEAGSNCAANLNGAFPIPANLVAGISSPSTGGATPPNAWQ